MTPDSQIIAAAGASALGLVGWLVRRAITHQDARLNALEKHVSELKQSMAAHDAGKELLDRMYNELQELTKLTSRIAGHLNIS